MKHLFFQGKRRSWFGRIILLLVVMMGTLAAVLGWEFVRFWHRLWRQPFLSAVPLAALPEEAVPQMEKARLIAIGDVEGAIEERPIGNGRHKLIINAGWRNFREPWARDFGFASFGLLEMNAFRVVKETLELFLHFQRPNGQFPVKIHSTNVLERYIYSLFQRQQPIHEPLRPKYRTAHRTISLDGNALLVIAALNYLRRVKDDEFAKRYWLSLKEGLHWLESRALEADGLLHQGAYTDWADSVKRVGCIHYTNVLYWKALHEFAIDATRYGFTAEGQLFEARAERLKEAIDSHFWREDAGFYRTSSQFSDVLSSSGNLLAVAWGLAGEEKGNRILDTMKQLKMAEPVPTKVTNRPYGSSYIALENKLAGIPHYHTSAAWLWLGAWHVVALSRINRLEEAAQLLERMSAAIVQDGVVHEVYGEDGRFLSTRWYTSEAPLTWSASLFIYANAYYNRALKVIS
ncbi:MAG: amylo-alpha-1,6-glucosidase [Candidatus Promineifilaceae bacterium]